MSKGYLVCNSDRISATTHLSRCFTDDLTSDKNADEKCPKAYIINTFIPSIDLYIGANRSRFKFPSSISNLKFSKFWEFEVVRGSHTPKPLLKIMLLTF